jgi:transcriptional regulator with XRE-family HTH domain
VTLNILSLGFAGGQVSTSTAVISNQDSSIYKNDEQRRRELADFLRSRRERLKPSPGKFVQISRRRTPGLRREEVAELSGVGATWYTWLEQARDIQPSSEVLDRIGKALELNAFELAHLFQLAGKVLPSALGASHEEVPTAVKSVVDHTLGVPAIVLGERFDLLYWNTEFNYLFGDMSLVPQSDRNWMYLLLCDKKIRGAITDWESHAKRILAEFRAAIGERIGSPWIAELLERMKREIPEFENWWKSHDVRERISLSFEMTHAQLGRISFERSVYSPVDAPKLRMVIYTPLTPGLTDKIAEKTRI